MYLEQNMAALADAVEKLNDTLNLLADAIVERVKTEQEGYRSAQPAVASNTGNGRTGALYANLSLSDPVVLTPSEPTPAPEVVDVKKPADTPPVIETGSATVTVTATPASASPSEITLPDLRRLGMAYAAKHGKEAAVALVESFGAKTVNQVDPSRYADLAAALSTAD